MAFYTYDEEADALYILLVDDDDAGIAKTIELTESLHVDLGNDGNPIGIEILNPTGDDGDLQPVREMFGLDLRMPFRFVA